MRIIINYKISNYAFQFLTIIEIIKVPKAKKMLLNKLFNMYVEVRISFGVLR